MLGARGRRQAEKLGIDPARVPPGQYLTERFPVLTVGGNPPFDLATDAPAETSVSTYWLPRRPSPPVTTATWPSRRKSAARG